MMSVNRVVLIGNLGVEPESRAFADGSPVCNLRIATSERWKDKVTGEQRELTEWHRVVLYRRLAEVAAQYLHKGSQVYVEGRLKTRKWTDAQGVERYRQAVDCLGETISVEFQRCCHVRFLRKSGSARYRHGNTQTGIIFPIKYILRTDFLSSAFRQPVVRRRPTRAGIAGRSLP